MLNSLKKNQLIANWKSGWHHSKGETDDSSKEVYDISGDEKA